MSQKSEIRFEFVDLSVLIFFSLDSHFSRSKTANLFAVSFFFQILIQNLLGHPDLHYFGFSPRSILFCTYWFYNCTLDSMWSSLKIIICVINKSGFNYPNSWLHFMGSNYRFLFMGLEASAYYFLPLMRWKLYYFSSCRKKINNSSWLLHTYRMSQQVLDRNLV